MQQLRRLFWNDHEARLRALPRLLGQLSLTVLVTFAVILALGNAFSALRDHGPLAALNKQTFDQFGNIVIAPFATLAIYLTLKFGARHIERRDFSIYGMTPSRAWRREFVLGLGLAAAVMTFLFVAERLAGWVHIEGYFGVTRSGNVLSVSLLFCVVKVVVVGICEELLFRGLVLRSLAEGLDGLAGMSEASSQWLALLLSAFLFGAIHLTNPNSGMASTVGIFFIGIFFGLGYIGTGRLAIPIGLHMAWNFFQGVVYGFPVSGDKEPVSFLLTRQSGSELFTGGNFGPEAGLMGIIAALLGTVVLLLYVKKEKWAGQPKLAVAGGESSTAVATDHDVASGPD